ncbi:MAG TPA: hypothetical protein VMU16_01495 [Candidatus Binataceae bacterium]|nr:hypothetical protein [Candidatus Binataceae bacterium]
MIDPQFRREAGYTALGSAAFAFCFGYSILSGISNDAIPLYIVQLNGPAYYCHDWSNLLQFHWVADYTLSHFHQFPLWNPYSCGGAPMLGNPHSAFLTPFLLLEILFGPLIGVRVEIVIHIAIAFCGAYFLARVLKISKLGAIACAGTFAGSSWYYLRMTIGHLGFMPFAYTPWVIAILFCGFENRRLMPAALGGGLMALMLMEGGLYPFLETALALAVLAAAISLERGSLLPLLQIAVAEVFAAGFASIKLLPGISYTGVNARIEEMPEFNNLSLLFTALFSRDPNFISVPGGPHKYPGFWEYGAHLGVIFAVLALIGAAFYFRRAMPWTIFALTMLALAAGNFGAFSPWALAHHLPFFASTEEPERWLIALTLGAGVLAGFGVDSVSSIAKPWGALFAAGLIVLAIADDWLVATPNMRLVVEGDKSQIPTSASFRQSADPDYRRWMFAAAKANLGTILCSMDIAPLTAVKGFGQEGYRGEYHLLGPGTVALERWTPNALRFDVDAPAPTALVLNQNADPGWRVTSGDGDLFSQGGLLAVSIPAGKRHVEIAYRPWQFIAGVGIALSTFVAMLALRRYEHRQE